MRSARGFGCARWIQERAIDANLENDDAVPTGMPRRDFIRKSAVIGGVGSLVWAAPGITSLGSRAFAEHTPINGEGDPERHAISFAAIAFLVCEDDTNPEDGTWYRVEYDDGWEVFPGDKGGQAGLCVPAEWSTATDLGRHPDLVDDDPTQEPFDFDLQEISGTEWILTLPFQCGGQGVVDVRVKSGKKHDDDGCAEDPEVSTDGEGNWKITILGKVKT